MEDFYNSSSQEYKDNIEKHFGDSTKFMQLTQNDFIYIPQCFALDWHKACTKLNQFNLNFVTCLFSSAFGVSKPEDVLYIKSNYVGRSCSPSDYKDHDVIHPLKFSQKKNRRFFEKDLKRGVGLTRFKWFSRIW